MLRQLLIVRKGVFSLAQLFEQVGEGRFKITTGIRKGDEFKPTAREKELLDQELAEQVEVQMLELDWVKQNTRDGKTPPIAYVHGEVFGVGGVEIVPDQAGEEFKRDGSQFDDVAVAVLGQLEARLFQRGDRGRVVVDGIDLTIASPLTLK